MGAAPMHHDGTILSLHPLKREKTVLRRINGVFRLLGEKITLEQFCAVCDSLRGDGPLKDLRAMRADCLRHGGSITEGNRRYGTTKDSAGRGSES